MTDAAADSGSFQTFQMMRSRLKLFQMALSLIVIFWMMVKQYTYIDQTQMQKRYTNRLVWKITLIL